MPGRKLSSSISYRYGFNGKEEDDEVSGDGNQYDYGFRIYNPRLGRFLSVDPLSQSYPWFTPYQFSANSPILNIDVDGLENENANSSSGCPYHAKTTKLGSITYIAPKDWNNWMAKKSFAEKGYFVSDPGAGKHTQFAVGFTNTLLAFTGFGLEIPAQIHYGDKIKPENKDKAFPVTGDGNIKRLTAEVILAPAFILRKIYENPTDGEGYGELVGLVALIKAPIKGRDVTSVIFTKFKSGTTFADYMGKPLGWFEFSPEKGLSFDLDIPKELQGQGLGSEIFSQAMKTTKAEKFTATWIESFDYENGSSVNLQRYREARNQGLSETDAAWETWSGGQARNNGFKTVSVKVLKNGIQATFTK